jgi:CubicO group peptidase (beta-lactamase class C family)
MFAVVVPALVQQSLAAQRDVSELLAPIREEHGVPALCGAIVDNGKVIALGADGVRRRGSEAKVTSGDLFHLGSCTKAMTATMIATLVEDGKLAWTTTAGEVFADRVAELHPSWRDVTLEQLLAHRGGAPADLFADGLWGRLGKREGTEREQRLQLVEGVLTKPCGEVGKFVYSNAGYALAGAMAEQVADAAWEELMRTRLFTPLGITSGGFGAPGTMDAVDQPRGHRQDGEPVDPGPRADNPPAIGPAGTVHMTLPDWAKFVALHVEAERGRPRLLSKETFAMLHAPAKSGGSAYALGWGVTERPWAGGTALTHAGSNTMWHCVVWAAPKRGFAVLAATNQGGDAAAKACDQAASALIAARKR